MNQVTAYFTLITKWYEAKANIKHDKKGNMS